MQFKESTKRLYDLTKDATKRKSEALPELVIQGFDEEQIWQQLELQNESELTHFLTRVSRLLAGNNKFELPLSVTRKEESTDDKVSEDGDAAKQSSNDDSAESDVAMDLDLDMSEKSKKHKTEFKRQIKNHSVVDDKFFKLEELDEYLTKEDKKETQGSKDEEDEIQSDEESVDLFDGGSDDEDEDVNSEDGKMLKYADFFDSPEDEGERMEKRKGSNFHQEDLMGEDTELEDIENVGSSKNNKYRSEEKRVKFNLTNDSDDTDSLEIRGENRPDTETKSSLEGRQERLQRRIEELENEAISEKPWQLKGEVAGTNRPQNSLLEEFVEFDITSRPAPVITEKTTLKLEDIIKQRIKDKAWDDVERKFKPVETPLEYKKKLVMDQEKSKKSLAQIYEDAYVKQKDALDPENAEREVEEPKEHVEIRGLIHSLFRKLDALSNFHYTPKLVRWPDN